MAVEFYLEGPGTEPFTFGLPSYYFAGFAEAVKPMLDAEENQKSTKREKQILREQIAELQAEMNHETSESSAVSTGESPKELAKREATAEATGIFKQLDELEADMKAKIQRIGRGRQHQ